MAREIPMQRLSAKLQKWPRHLLFLFGLGLTLRLVFVALLQDGFYFPDSLSYTRAAGRLLTTGEVGPVYQRAPGYPYFLAPIQMLFGGSILAIRLVESVVGTLLAVVIAVLAKRIGGPGVGALAGILWSVYPMGIFIVGLVYPTALMAMLLACGAWCVLPRGQDVISPKGVFLGGLVLGVAALTVPVGLATIAFVSLWILYWGGVGRVFLLALFILGSSVTLIPWTVRNYGVHGRVVPVDSRMENHLPRMPGSSVPASPLNKGAGKVEGILQNPVPFIARAAKQFVYFWRLYPERLRMNSPQVRERYHRRDPRVIKFSLFSGENFTKTVSVLSTLPLFVFALIGTGAMWTRKERRRDLSFLWTIILSFAIGYSFFFAKIRFRVPIEPYLVILAAYGVTQTWSVFWRTPLIRPALQREQSTSAGLPE